MLLYYVPEYSTVILEQPEIHLHPAVQSALQVDRVAVASAEDGRYPAWPADATLQNFDRADRIFVALVLSSPKRSRIVNAVDSDDREYARPLKKLGVRIEELCPNCLK